MANPKSIILTGASRGIGLAIARFLLKDGHKLFLVARSGEPLEKLKGEFKGQVEYLAADLSDFKVSDLLVVYFGCCSLRAVSLNSVTFSGRSCVSKSRSLALFTG
jgi:NAD(P)-dependent dehydrogenase (short-subunit alcohol dehydrogenase family)